MIDYTSPYLTSQIIAYIGNKRKLLPLIYSALESSGLELKRGLKFFDAFAGSGVVSRFAKSLGFEVFCNDWEYYAHIINSTYLGINKSDINTLFGSQEELLKLLHKINTLPDPDDKDQYIAKFYAPKEFDTQAVDYRTERLFYTRQNALAIDKIRNYIEENYPPDSKDKHTQKRRSLLIALLLYEAATHTNTSGVFKAFHKEFGGHGKDALKRILSPILLELPVLEDSMYPMHIFQEDSNTLVKKLSGFDIAYLDPPYNQHQYSSNYHLLNTVARWDHIEAPLDLNEKGVLKEKAGIRHDWLLTQSAYCYKSDAGNAFLDLINNIDAKRILISYSTDGIIPFDQMRDICMTRGDTTIVTNEYTTYRGGKQSNSRKTANIEFVLCIDTTKKATKNCIAVIDALITKKKFLLLFKQKFAHAKLAQIPGITFTENADRKCVIISIKLKDKTVTMESLDSFVLYAPDEYEELTIPQIQELTDILSRCTCETKEEELSELLNIACRNEKWAKLLPATLKKLASKKNKELYFKWLSKIEQLQLENEKLYETIRQELEEVKSIAHLRFTT